MSCTSTMSYGGQRRKLKTDFTIKKVELENQIQKAKSQLGNIEDEVKDLTDSLHGLKGKNKTKAQNRLRELRAKKRNTEDEIKSGQGQLESLTVQMEQQLGDIDEEEKENGPKNPDDLKSMVSEVREFGVGAVGSHEVGATGNQFPRSGAAKGHDENRIPRSWHGNVRSVYDLGYPTEVEKPKVYSNGEHPRDRTQDWLQRNFEEDDNRQQSTGGRRDDKFIARQTIGKELPIFGGQPEEWPAFIAQYKYTTDACKFTDIENLYRLQKSLKGMAKEMVQGLLTSPDNVNLIIKKLGRIFGRPEFIIDSLMKKAREAPSPVHGKPGTMVSFENVVSNIVATVKTLDRSEHLMNPSLLRHLVNKMDSIYKEKWAEFQIYRDIGVPSLDDFSTWLGVTSNAALLLASPADILGWNKTDDRYKRKEHFSVAVEPEREKKRLSCWYCDTDGHALDKCSKLKAETIENRWKWVRENGRCFSCLGRGHSQEACRRKKQCNANGCMKYHHPLLHSEEKKIEHNNQFFGTHVTTTHNEVSTPMWTRTGKEFRKHVIGSLAGSDQKLLKFVPVTLVGPEAEVEAYVFMDEGATCSILDMDTAKMIGCSGPNEPLELKWTNGITRLHAESELVTLKIRAQDGKEYEISNAQTVQDPELPVQNINVDTLKGKYPHLRRAECKNMFDARPLLLLGEDYVHLTVAREVLTKTPEDGHTPIASRTLLGWAIHGPTGYGRNKKFSFTVIKQKKEYDDELHSMVKESFKLDAFGLEVRPRKLKSDDEIRADKLLDSTTIKIADNRWETGLLWRTDDVKFPSSKAEATKRLNSVERKMDKDKEYGKWYLEKIQYYVDNGYCKKLSKEEEAVESEKTFYMPHFAASNINKPGKLRWVCDAAAKANGVSLNDKLLTGPDQLNSLPGILLRFRRRKIAFGGDVKEMFHQIRVKKEDQDSQRFLFRGMDRKSEPDVYRMDVLIFGASSSPCSAQYVMKRNADQFADTCPKSVVAIHRNIFMDDYLDCQDEEETAVQRVKEVIKIQSAGGMEMLKWITNSEFVRKSIPEERRAGSPDLNVTEDPVERILGIFWASHTDRLIFKLNLPKLDINIVNGSKRPTKRDALKMAMSLFDPLGLIAHYTIRVKILIQDIWKTKTDWDEEINDACWSKWKCWISQLMDVNNIFLPRCYSPKMPQAKEINLHIFTDSSEQAYSMVAYIQVVYETGIEVSFVIGKANVAPVKTQSMPRLELQGALMGTRVAMTIRDEMDLDFTSTTFWTDSRIVLCWIRSSTRNFKIFVSSRVGEILESSDVSQWRWVPTKENPSDDATRDKLTTDLSSTARWLRGPDFLQLGPEGYPVEITGKGEEAITDADLEIKKQVICVINAQSSVLNYKKYSCYLKLIRIQAWILKWKKKISAKKNGEVYTIYLSVGDMKHSELLLLKKSQEEKYGPEIHSLKKNRVLEKDSIIYQFNPYLDEDGLIRMKSRIAHYKPIILDGSHPITQLLMMEFHCAKLHGGTETVLNELRKLFWIPKLRACLKRVTFNCMRCRVAAANVEQPMMGDLPECRMVPKLRPFSYCGVDYFGPMTVAVNRRREKRYGVLFVCMTTGAISLDFANFLSTDSCIMAVNRLAARRGGKPVHMLSDNGTNFIGANAELKRALKDIQGKDIAAKLANNGIDWKFIPPRSPNFGGRWERQIKTVKIALGRTLTFYNKRVPTEEILRTLLLEVEYLVNSRPLTHVSVDQNDEEALTPNHFLFGSVGTFKTWGTFTDDDVILRQEWRKMNRMADYFWERWTNEYLPTQAPRQKWNDKKKGIKIGDLVFIVEPGAPRGSWIRGIVEKLHPGKDGIVRVVEVKTSGGIFRRAVSKCAVIDVVLDQEPSP